MALDAPAHGTPAASQAGFALMQDPAWPLRPGLTLGLASGIGERVALGLAPRPGGGSAVALRASARMAAELDRLGGPPLRLALSVQAVRSLLRAEGPPHPADCTLQLELAARAGAPFHVNLPCGASGPIGFGLRAAF